MNFIKNNKILFGAFALTFLLAFVMIGLDIWMYSQFGQNKTEVDAKINEYIELTKKTPAPTKKNVNTITYEYKTIQKRLNRLQRQFGKYLRKPLLVFARELLNVPQKKNEGVQELSKDELDGLCEDELLEAFRKYCDELPKEKKMLFNGETDAEIFVGFMDRVLVPMVAGKLAVKDGKSPEKPDEAIVKKAKLNIQNALTKFEKNVSEGVAKDEDDNAVDGKDKKDDEDDENAKEDIYAPVKGSLVPLTIVGTTLYPNPVSRREKETEEDFRKRVVQSVSRTSGYQYLMEAMGLPRTVDIGRFQAQLKTAKNNLIRRKGLIPGITAIEKESDRSELVSSITFRESDMPVQSRVFYLVRQMQIRYDIFRRFPKNGVLKLEKFTSLSPLEGEKKADRFSRYVFEIVLLARMEAVRKLMNHLLDASKDNVYYNILYAEFERPVPEDIDKALTESKFIGRRDGQNQGEGNEKDEQKSMITKADIVAVGADQSVRAVLKFEVLVFTGEDIARVGADAK